MSYPNYPRGYPPPPQGGYYPPPQQGYYPPPQPGYPPQPRPPQPYPGQQQPQYSAQYGEAFYFVKSKLNGLVLDVQGGTARPGSRVITWHQKPEPEAGNQLWHQDPYTGTIKSKLTPNLCLTPYGSDMTLQEIRPGRPEQQMTVSGDRMHLRHDMSRVVDIAQGNPNPGAKVTLWQYSGALSQQWEFVRAIGAGAGTPTPYQPPQPTPTSAPGPAPYQAPAPAPGPGPVPVSSPGPVMIPSAPEPEPAKPSNPSTGMIMAGAVAAGAAAGAAAATAKTEKAEEEKVDKRPFFIITEMGNKVLDVKKAKLSAGTEVVLYDRNKDVSANQLWCFDDKQVLHSKLNNFVIDTSSGVARLQPEKPGDPNQQWYIDGRKILNKAKPNECLDVKKAKCKNNQNIIPYPYKGDTNQHWHIDHINF